MKPINVLSLFDGRYFATKDGQIFSTVGTTKPMMGKITSWGYRSVILTNPKTSRRTHVLVHRVIAEEFIPNPNGHPVVNHKDGNKLNNSIDNLEWTTQSKNLLHARDNALLKTCKITMDIANEIRDVAKSGRFTQKQLASAYGLGKTTIGYILNNKLWKI